MNNKKYKKMSYSIHRILNGNTMDKDNMEVIFENGIHYIDFRRQATKYFFELFEKTKKEYYGSLWEISLSVLLWWEDSDLDGGVRAYFDRYDKYELLKITSNKFDNIVNWKNLKLEREAAIDSLVHYFAFDFMETKITDNETSNKFLVIDEGLFHRTDIEI